MNTTKYRAAAELIASKFGVDLDKYSPRCIAPLLDALPDSIATCDAASLSLIVSACSIGETVFMRRPEHFAALERRLPTLSAAAEGRPLSVWSAGCATGEEAYSLAAVLAGYPTGVRVLGTDVNPAAIERARAGRYRLWSVRGTDLQAGSSWLSLDALSVTVQHEIRKLVELSVQNLAGDRYPTGMDVIFCRNVLLYFCAGTAEAVLARFHESLRPGGLLFLGDFDPVPAEGDLWATEQVGSVRYFWKLCHAEERVPSPQQGPTSPPACPEVRQTEVPTPPVEDPRRRACDILSLARSLCDQGASEEALRRLAAFSREAPLEVEPYVLAAMIAEEAGRFAAALDAARRAHFLAPNEPICDYLFSVCLDRSGEPRQAALHLSESRSALDRVKDLRLPLPFGGGITGVQLRRMMDASVHDVR